MNKKKVLLWMSGWIDSTVCAYLLKEQWYEVVWVFMKYWVDPAMSAWIWKEDKISENKCCSLEAQMSAKNTCDKLWIEFHVWNITENFFESVVSYFLKIHKKWLTPNPCVHCNEKIKWWNIVAKLEKFNCDYISTGHYARIKEFEWKKYIQEWIDKWKDQSYFLSVLTHDKIWKVILPLWEMKKEETKKLAKKYWEEEVFKKKESQWVCFYSEDSYVPFLKRHAWDLFEEWDFVYVDNKWKEEVVWRHKWLPYYTIWQRKWIWVWGFENPVYVFWFCRNKNQVLIWEDDKLWKKNLILDDCHLLTQTEELLKHHKKSFFEEIKHRFFPELEKRIFIRIRHLWKLNEVKKIERLDGKKIKVYLKKWMRAITPGQYAVLYSWDERALGNWMIIW